MIVPQFKKDYKCQTNSQHHTEGAKAESLSSSIRNKTKLFIFTTLVKQSMEVLVGATRQEK